MISLKVLNNTNLFFLQITKICMGCFSKNITSNEHNKAQHIFPFAAIENKFGAQRSKPKAFKDWLRLCQYSPVFDRTGAGIFETPRSPLRGEITEGISCSLAPSDVVDRDEPFLDFALCGSTVATLLSTIPLFFTQSVVKSYSLPFPSVELCRSLFEYFESRFLTFSII